MTFPKIEIKWDSVSDVHVYIKSDVVILFWQYCHVRTCQTSGNQIYRPQICGTHKLTGKIVLVLQREVGVSLFGHDTFQRYVFMLSTRFVRISGNGLSHKTRSHFLFAQHLEAYLMRVAKGLCVTRDGPKFAEWRVIEAKLSAWRGTATRQRDAWFLFYKPVTRDLYDLLIRLTVAAVTLFLVFSVLCWPSLDLWCLWPS